jgi:pyruvate dehydrogenase E2 component (dihydrolipoamide acetyltransferase)
MAGEIFMPQLGLTMKEGTLVQWLKAVGEEVRAGDPIMLVETDKATQEVPAMEDGILGTILIEEGATVAVGTVLAYYQAAIEKLLLQESRKEAPTEPRPNNSVERVKRSLITSSRMRATPLARRVAAKNDVNLELVTGRGPGGRILASDVQRYIEGNGFPQAQPQLESRILKDIPPVQAPPVYFDAGGRLIELQGSRKITAERMAYSFSTAPHFYLTVEVDAGNMIALRQQIKPTAEKKFNVEITISDIIIKSAAISLRENPWINASWTGSNTINEHLDANVGVATAVNDGLIVPVIKKADQLSLVEIARRRSTLVEQARSGRLGLKDLEACTFTVSNLGMYGIDLFQAIVNPPQAAILAVGRIKERPVVYRGEILARPTMYLSLSSDHRILDGVMASGFLSRVVELIEDPMELMLSAGLGG